MTSQPTITRTRALVALRAYPDAALEPVLDTLTDPGRRSFLAVAGALATISLWEDCYHEEISRPLTEVRGLVTPEQLLERYPRGAAETFVRCALRDEHGTEAEVATFNLCVWRELREAALAFADGDRARGRAILEAADAQWGRELKGATL